MRMEGEKQCQKRGLWTEEEDKILADYVKLHGKGQWNRIVKKTGLKRCGKSCRLRWINYLSPTVNRGNFTKEEEDLIARLHKLLGNRWSLIAKRVPGRTDNQVKNYWNTHLSKKLGIKKRNTDMKTRNAATSPPPIHSAGSDKLSETSTNSASSSPSHVKNTETTEQTVLGGCSHDQAAVDASESQKMSPSTGHEGSFCGFTDEFELSILSSMDFLNECVADFDWQCL